MALVPPTIHRFQGQYRFLSNFWHAPIYWTGDNGHEWIFPSNEHAYQAWKCRRQSQVVQIQTAKTAAHAKWLGQRVELRPDWDTKRMRVMLFVNRLKYRQHEHLARRLIETGEATLEEGNNWGDRFWGVCLKTHKGENHLGHILMQVRTELRVYGPDWFDGQPGTV